MDKQDVKFKLLDEYSKISSDDETSYFINDLADTLCLINEEYSNTLVEYGLYSKEKAIQKNSITEKYIKQATENVKENIKLSMICKKAVEAELTKAENESLKIDKENLTNKVRKAQELINEAQIEVEKTKKATLNNIKKNMQISRDRIVAIVNTTFTLGDQINKKSDIASMEVTLNNIIENIGILTDEFSLAGLWDSDEYKPSIKPILLEDSKGQENVIPKKTNRKRTAKKILDENNSIENIEHDDEIINIKNETEIVSSVGMEVKESNNTIDNFERLNQVTNKKDKDNDGITQINISEFSSIENKDN
jgi:hypothetical protein